MVEYPQDKPVLPLIAFSAGIILFLLWGYSFAFSLFRFETELNFAYVESGFSLFAFILAAATFIGAVFFPGRRLTLLTGQVVIALAWVIYLLFTYGGVPFTVQYLFPVSEWQFAELQSLALVLTVPSVALVAVLWKRMENFDPLGATRQLTKSITREEAGAVQQDHSPPPPDIHWLAVLAFVFSFFGATALIGVILGLVALKEISKSAGRKSGRGLALAAVVLGSVFVIALLGWLFAVFVLPSFL